MTDQSNAVDTQPVLLSINNYHYRRGGAEVVYLEQNRLFDEQGWSVVPFAMKHPNNFKTEWDKYFVDEIEFGHNYSLFEKIKSATKVVYSFEAQNKIGQLVDEVQPVIAHAHNVYHHISPSIFNTLKKRNIPTVLTLHDLKIACPAYKMLNDNGVCEQCKGGKNWNVIKNRCVKQSLLLSSIIFTESMMQKMMGSYSKGVDRFIVPSKFYLEKFVEWGWPREKFSYIPNFVELSGLIPDGKPSDTFVYFGRLSEEKGIKTLIRAAAQAQVPVQLVGTGPIEAELEPLIQELNAPVTLMGYQSGQDLYDLIKAARAIVLPSEWYENAPISIMEAYAFERPVIGAQIGGIPEMVKEGETGSLFESGNVDALAERLQSFAQMRDDDIITMGKAGRKWVEEEFTVNNYIERVKAVYRELGVAC